jgi:hypothetical protein
MRKGDNWNKKALDLVIEGPQKQIDFLKTKENLLKEKIQKFIKPTKTGFLIRNIDYLINDDVDVTLPIKSV